MSITISMFYHSQWKEYKTIRLEALKEDPKAFGSSYEKENAFTDREWQERPSNPDNCILVAKDEGILVGMIGYHLKDQGKDAHLWGMFVKKEYRGQGIGKLLLEEIIKKVKSLGNVKKISLDVNPEQIAAVKLYTSMDFQQSGQHSYLMGDGVEHTLLTFELNLK